MIKEKIYTAWISSHSMDVIPFDSILFIEDQDYTETPYIYVHFNDVNTKAHPLRGDEAKEFLHTYKNYIKHISKTLEIIE